MLSPEKAGGIKLPEGSLSWLKGAFRFLRLNPSQESFLPLSVLPEFFRRAQNTGKLPPDSPHPDPIVMQLTKLLEQVMGYSPLQYATAWKLENIATQLRKATSLPLVELTAEYGFNDQKHFRTLFSRRFGLTPSAYRKNPPPEK